MQVQLTQATLTIAACTQAVVYASILCMSVGFVRSFLRVSREHL